MDNPKVTWLISVKNGMPFIEETLRGIYNSNYKNQELLILDNGSTDGTLEEINKWIPERIKGRLIIDNNCTLGAARAKLICEAHSEYCLVVDSDDIPTSNRIIEQLAALEKDKTIAVVGSQLILINEKSSVIGCLNVPLRWADILLSMLIHNVIAQPSVMLRRSLILDVGNYRDISYAEDYDLWLRVLKKYKIVNLKGSVVEYRIRADSETRKAIKAGVSATITQDIAAMYSNDLWGVGPDVFKGLKNLGLNNKIAVYFKIVFYVKNKCRMRWRDLVLSKVFLAFTNNYFRPS